MAPDYIVNNWTEELLELMIEKLGDRKRRESEAVRGRPLGQEFGKVPDEVLFGRASNLIKVAKNVN